MRVNVFAMPPGVPGCARTRVEQRLRARLEEVARRRASGSPVARSSAYVIAAPNGYAPSRPVCCARVPRPDVEVRLGDRVVARRRAVVGPRAGALGRRARTRGRSARARSAAPVESWSSRRAAGARPARRRERVPVGERGGGRAVDRQRRVGSERRRRRVDVGGRAERDADELGRGAERRDADARVLLRRARARARSPSTRTRSPSPNGRRAEPTRRRTQPDVLRRAVARGREHVLGERVQRVARRRERGRERFEHCSHSHANRGERRITVTVATMTSSRKGERTRAVVAEAERRGRCIADRCAHLEQRQPTARSARDHL